MAEVHIADLDKLDKSDLIALVKQLLETMQLQNAKLTMQDEALLRLTEELKASDDIRAMLSTGIAALRINKPTTVA